MIREKSPTILTEVGARRLTARLRDALVTADDLLAQAYAGRAWEALGYADFPSYCAAELPELRRVKLRVGPRRERAAKLLREGASRRDIAAANGCDVATAHRDALVIEGRAPVANATPAPTMTNWQRAVVEVASRAGRGLTCLELEQHIGWRHGTASAALHRAEKLGHVRRIDRFRQRYAVYVAA